MSRGRRKRDARRRARGGRPDKPRERPPEDVSAEAADVPQEGSRGGEEPLTVAAAAARRSRTERKRAKRKGGLWERVGRVHVSPWLIATPVVATVVVIVVVLIMTSGSLGTTGGTGAVPTPDPRVVGLPIDVSFDIEAGDDGTGTGTGSFFRPDSFTANAADVVEFVMTNTGSVTHNIWVAGPDNEYETSDDFGPTNLITPGETDRLVVKIDDPDIYLFRCQIHPQLQFGTLILS